MKPQPSISRQRGVHSLAGALAVGILIAACAFVIFIAATGGRP